MLYHTLTMSIKNPVFLSAVGERSLQEHYTELSGAFSKNNNNNNNDDRLTAFDPGQPG